MPIDWNLLATTLFGADHGICAEGDFLHGTGRLPDPDTTMTPEQVKTVYSAAYPELTNAELTGPTVNGDTLEYEFRKAVGTKG